MPENIDQVDGDEVMQRVHRAITKLENEDLALFNPLGSERNIAQRFALWLQNEFPDWDIDCEYDQIVDHINQTAKKKVAGLLMIRQKNGGFRHLSEPSNKKVIPDIIIHHRGYRENLVAIEIKTSNDNEEIEFDKEKLTAYRMYEPLQYRYSLFVRFQLKSGENNIVAEEELNP